jgi:hypothetical protein
MSANVFQEVTMQFWLVSPNIDMKGGRTLEKMKIHSSSRGFVAQ